MKLKRFNFKTVNSTNDLAIRIIKSTNIKSGMVIAEKQTKGRGQYGKKWVSYKGNLFGSIFFPIDKIKLSLKNLTKVNCLLIRRLLLEFYKGKILIKSPNDLLINKKKVSGILQETLIKNDKRFIVVGIGINLIKSPKIRFYPTTSLFELTNMKIEMNEAALKLKQIYEKFIPVIQKFNIKNIDKI
ncbi:biotin--[acetyl-CoA-carboxylase] ligase [Candidatus Pelagibacter sp.]|nr:biotin--[acetyl-CoA-carboxylase] ligase [Candidatus Pelagibacter sp.]